MPNSCQQPPPHEGSNTLSMYTLGKKICPCMGWTELEKKFPCMGGTEILKFKSSYKLHNCLKIQAHV